MTHTPESGASFLAPDSGVCVIGITVVEKDRIESLGKIAKCYGYLPSDFEDVHTLVESMESKLFNTVMSNPHHVLYQLLPPEKDIGCNLRQRPNSLTFPLEDNLIRKNFLHRMLFRDIHLSLIHI